MKKKKKGEEDLRMTGIEEEKDYKENRRKVLSRKNFSSISCRGCYVDKFLWVLLSPHTPIVE